VIFDRVVCAAFENLGDFGPSVALLHPVHEEQNPLLLARPGNVLDHGVEVVVPALSALLPKPVGHILSEKGPVVRAVDIDQL